MTITRKLLAVLAIVLLPACTVQVKSSGTSPPNKVDTTTAQVQETDAPSTVVPLNTLQSWAVMYEGGIQSWLGASSTQASSFGGITTEAGMVSACTTYLRMVTQELKAPETASPLAPDEWFNMLKALGDALVACIQSDFNAAANGIRLAAQSSNTFTQLLKDNTP